MPQTLRSLWLSRLCAAPQSQQKATFLLPLLPPPFTFKALSADPAPTSPKAPVTRAPLAKRVPPSVAAVYLLSSVYPQHKAHADTQAALCTLSRRHSRGCNLHQWCPKVSGAPAGNTDAHLSAQQIQCKENPPLRVLAPASWINMRQKQRGKEKRREQKLFQMQEMMVESRGWKCGESSHWGKRSTPRWA